MSDSPEEIVDRWPFSPTVVRIKICNVPSLALETDDSPTAVQDQRLKTEVVIRAPKGEKELYGLGFTFMEEDDGTTLAIILNRLDNHPDLVRRVTFTVLVPTHLIKKVEWV